MADTKLDKVLILRGGTPSDNVNNGIDWLNDRACENPDGFMILAVCVIEVEEASYITKLGGKRAKTHIQQIEAVPLEEAPADVKAWMTARRAERIGAETLPYDDEDEAGLSDPLDDAGLTDAVAVLPADSDNLVRAPFGGRR